MILVVSVHANILYAAFQQEHISARLWFASLVLTLVYPRLVA